MVILFLFPHWQCKSHSLCFFILVFFTTRSYIWSISSPVIFLVVKSFKGQWQLLTTNYISNVLSQLHASCSNFVLQCNRSTRGKDKGFELSVLRKMRKPLKIHLVDCSQITPEVISISALLSFITNQCVLFWHLWPRVLLTEPLINWFFSRVTTGNCGLLLLRDMLSCISCNVYFDASDMPAPRLGWNVFLIHMKLTE